MSYKILVFLPLVTALIAGLFGRRIGVRASHIITTAGVMLSCFLSWKVFLDVGLAGVVVHDIIVLPWINIGSEGANWALKFDSLTAVMLIVVTTISSLVHLYSIGYMADDPSQPRFMAYLSLFTFAMLMLVTANNLVQMFFGWEGVGLASYLLIGFWYHKPSANAAAIKAFVVNRVGDFGFALGILALFQLFGSVRFDVIFDNLALYADRSYLFLGVEVQAYTAICLLLFLGAMGKSAQLGLHTWLPDAMEGPTPVSALIHAATMVTAGVFLVARCSPLFEHAPFAGNVVAIVGASTAFFAATIGMTQFDIKRVIAYSTCSQLGYMFFALGVGAYGAAIFHLYTHAFFKALLFLGAGSVIHAMHHEQDMRNYGALRTKIPYTFYFMLIGTLAIVGFPYLSAYYSKDIILESAWAAHSSTGFYSYSLGIAAALMTSFYSWRLMFLTFFGKPRWDRSEHICHAVRDHQAQASQGAAEGTAGYHPHESPMVMLIPLFLLALGAIVVGGMGYDTFVGASHAQFWGDSIRLVGEDVMDAAHHVTGLVKHAPSLAALIGFLIAVYAYIINTDFPLRVVQKIQPLYLFVFRKWYFDELYDRVFVRPALRLGAMFWKKGDGQIIDGLGPDGVAAATTAVAFKIRRLQTGFVYSYAFAMIAGLIVFTLWLLPRLFAE